MSAKTKGLTRGRGGSFVYRQHVPNDVRAVIGITSFYRYLGAGRSRRDAETEARRLRLEFDALIDRARSLSPEQRREAIASGGLIKSDQRNARLLTLMRAAATDVAGPMYDPDIDLTDPSSRALAAEQTLSTIETRQTLAALERAAPSPHNNTVPLFDIWKQRVQPRSKDTLRSARAELAAFAAFTLNKPAGEVTREDVRAFRAHLETQAIRRQTVRLKLSRLRAVYAQALDAGAIAVNPFDGVTVRVPEAERLQNATRDRVLTPAQVRSLFDAIEVLPADFQLVVRAMAYQGARCIEIANLQSGDFENVDGVAVMHIRDAKNFASHRTIPVHPQCGALTAYASTRTGYLFEGADKLARVKRLRRLINPLMKKLGLDSLHALRHTWRHRSLVIGMPDEIAARLLGHALRSEHFKYGHVPLSVLLSWLRRCDPLA